MPSSNNGSPTQTNNTTSFSISLPSLRCLSKDEVASVAIDELPTLLQLNSQCITEGLSLQECRERYQKFGPNEMESKEKESLLKKFLEQFKEPMILLLLGSAFISLCIQNYDDAISIALAVLIVSTVAFIQEYRSDQALEKLKNLMTYTCTVIRNGNKEEIFASDVVVGDLVEFKMGDRIPADLRIVNVVGHLSMDESIFTGEVNPSKKVTQHLDSVHPQQLHHGQENAQQQQHISDYKNIAFMGSLVCTGKGRGICFSIGQQTELGKISSMLHEIEETTTPLQQAMDKLSKQISIFSFAVIGFIFIIGVLSGRHWLQMFTMGISLAVAAIPEGLPIVTVVTLAMGVLRMARKKAIVRNLPSVESLGATNVICVDKTGTLTQNEQTCTKIFTLSDRNHYIKVSGVGYHAKGEFFKMDFEGVENSSVSIKPLEEESLLQIFQVSNLCNEAHFTGNKMLIGQPTEGALIALCKKANFSDLREEEHWTKLDEIPFSSETKWMAIQYKNEKTKQTLYFAKGSTDQILDKCTTFLNSNQQSQVMNLEDKIYIERVANVFASETLRVLALAQGEDVNAMTFVGLVALYDPPREGVKESVQKLKQSGVKIIMITGDSKATAVAIAKELGIISEENLLEGEDKIALSTQDLQNENLFEQRVSDACVFYRMAPVHKMNIVKALQKRGYIVAMTGDGINDSPALKQAHIGISMGKSGTDVSKEASKMILVDDNFSTILAAIEEGKSIFNNIKNFLRYQLTTSISCMLLVICCTILGYELPLNAMQILWINLIMDGFPAQSLGLEPCDEEVMRQPPRDVSKPIITRKMIISISISSFIMFIGTLFIFLKEMGNDGLVTSRDTTMTFTTFVMFQIFNAFNCRNEKKSILQIGVFSNTTFNVAIGLSVLCQLGLLYVPFLTRIFDTEPISLNDWLFILFITCSVLIYEEIVKYLNQRSGKQPQDYTPFSISIKEQEEEKRKE